MTGLYTLDSAALHARLGLLAALASARKNLMLLPSGGGSGAALQRLQLVGEIARVRKELGGAADGRSQEQVSADEAARLFADLRRMNADPEWSGADGHRYEFVAKRIDAASEGRPDAVKWAREWLSELDSHVEEVQQQEVAAQSERDAANARYAAEVAAGRSGNPLFQAWLDTLEDPASAKNYQYIIWNSRRGAEFDKLWSGGKRDLNGNVSTEYSQAREAYFRRWADEHLSERVKAQKGAQAEEAPTAAESDDPRPADASAPAAAEAIVEHATVKGKVLRGVVRHGLTLTEAQKIDKYTFRKDGGYFIREKYLQQLDAAEQAPPDAEAARAELGALTAEAQRRMAEAAESAGVGVALSGAEIDYLTAEEKTRRHELLEQLREPDSAEQAAERVQERIKARREEGAAVMPVHWKDKLLAAATPGDVVTVERVREQFERQEGMFEVPQMRAEPSEADIVEQAEALKVSRQGAATERTAIPKYEQKVRDGLEAAFDLLAQGWTLNAIGSRKQQAGAGGKEYLERGGQYMASARMKIAETLKDAAFLEALKRRQEKPSKAGKSLDERLGMAPQAKRRNRPLEYTGYSGQARSVRSYYEAGGYRIAKPHEGLFEVIDKDGQAIHQMAGLGGALSVVQRLGGEQPTTWEKLHAKVWKGSNGMYIVDESFTSGGRLVKMFAVYASQDDRHAGSNFTSGESLAEAKRKAAGVALDDASLQLDSTGGVERLALLAELRRAMEALGAADDPAVRLDLLAEVARLRKALGSAEFPVVELAGDELGDFPDTPDGKKALRQAAIAEFERMTNGDGNEWVDCPALDERIELRRKGIKKVVSTSADTRKLLIVPRLKDLIRASAKIGAEKPNYDAASSNIAAYQTMRALVMLDGELLAVRFVLGRDDKSRYHYDHTIHAADAVLDSTKANGPAEADPLILMGGIRGRPHDRCAVPKPCRLLPAEPSPEHQDDLILDRASGSVNDETLNLFIEGEPPEPAEDAAPIVAA